MFHVSPGTRTHTRKSSLGKQSAAPSCRTCSQISRFGFVQQFQEFNYFPRELTRAGSEGCPEISHDALRQALDITSWHCWHGACNTPKSRRGTPGVGRRESGRIHVPSASLQSNRKHRGTWSFSPAQLDGTLYSADHLIVRGPFGSRMSDPGKGLRHSIGRQQSKGIGLG